MQQAFVYQVPHNRSISVAIIAADRDDAKKLLDSFVRRPLEWCLVVQQDRPDADPRAQTKAGTTLARSGNRG